MKPPNALSIGIAFIFSAWAGVAFFKSAFSDDPIVKVGVNRAIHFLGGILGLGLAITLVLVALKVI
jgi:hypothetical protein